MNKDLFFSQTLFKLVIASLLLPSFVFLTLYPLPPPVKDSRRILILLHLILLLLPLIPIL